ncbi:MAG: sigma-70 family RNA polymerase sigma factor [Firmicutes bacterium]|nr:sigma-70 family RNA polymerase sigma factor [Bacillota bacterium]
MNDEYLVKEIQRGNSKVFSQLVDNYKNRIYAMAYKFTKDYQETQDLSQEIFIKIYNQIDKFKFKSKVSTWIYRVATNTCLDWKKKKRPNVIEWENMTTGENEAFNDNIQRDLPLEKLLKEEYQDRIHNIISNMKDMYKTVIIMYHFNEMSYSEIANVLDVPRKTVETRLYRARRNLKDELKKEKLGGGDEWIVKKY